MKNEKNKFVKISHTVLIICFIVGVVVIATYPFKNRSLSIRFITKSEDYTIDIKNSDIAIGKVTDIFLDETTETIVKIRFYGFFKSILLKEIGYDELVGYIADVYDGTCEWTKDGLVFNGNNNIHVAMNDNWVDLLKRISDSYFQERFIYCGCLFCIIALLWFIISAIAECEKEENWNNHGPVFEIKKFCADIRKYGQYMVYAAKTDLKAEVADSYLNRLWWLLEPFFNMLVYVIVFGSMMGNSIENYATFVFSALLMWNFFSKTINYSVKLVRNNKDIISKVYIPKFVILISNMILNLFKLLFSMIVLVVMMLLFRVQIGFNLLWVIPAYMTMVLIAFGVGMIFLHFGVYVDDLSYAVGILLNMLMFLSGIFYNAMITLPEPFNKIMMCFNPVAVTIDTMRNALLYNTAANLPILWVWFGVAVILCGIGVHIVYKNENSYVKIV